MTEELAIAHYFKRLAIIDSQFGNVDHHLTKFVDMQPQGAAQSPMQASTKGGTQSKVVWAQGYIVQLR